MNPPDKKKKLSRQSRFSAKGTSSKALGWREYALGLMPVMFWGTAFYFVAETLVYLHPATLVWLRLSIGFLFLLSLPINQTRHSINFTDWIKLAILGIIWLGLPFTFFSIAQQWIDSSLAGMLIGGQPILATVMASFFLGALPTRRNTLGLSFGLGGIILAAWPSLTSGDSTTLGVILVFSAILCYGFATNFVIPMVQKWGGYFVTVRALGFASLAAAPWGIYGIFDSNHQLVAYVSLAILGIGATAITPFAFSMLSARVGATRASSINFLIPLVALYMGSFIRNEMINGLSLIGLGLILIGIVIMGGADDRH